MDSWSENQRFLVSITLLYYLRNVIIVITVSMTSLYHCLRAGYIFIYTYLEQKVIFMFRDKKTKKKHQLCLCCLEMGKQLPLATIFNGWWASWISETMTSPQHSGNTWIQSSLFLIICKRDLVNVKSWQWLGCLDGFKSCGKVAGNGLPRPRILNVNINVKMLL